MAMKHSRPVTNHADHADRVDGCPHPVDRRADDQHDGDRRGAEDDADQDAGGDEHAAADTGGPEPPGDAELARRRDEDGQRDDAERAEDHADVAGDVVVVGRDAAELGVGDLAEHAGDDEHRHEREAEEPDRHHRLAEQEAQLEPR